MRTIDLICEACGETNPAGSEFCSNCNEFLAWDRSVLIKPPGRRGASPPPGPGPVPPGSGPSAPTQPGPAGQATPFYVSDPNAGHAQPGYPATPPVPSDQGYPPAYPPQPYATPADYPTQPLPAAGPGPGSAGTAYDQGGWDQQAYDQQAYEQQQWNQQAYDQQYGQQQWNQQAYDQGQYNQGQYEQGQYAQGQWGPGQNPSGYDQGGYGPPSELTCPSCGQVNPGTKRFCARCGYSFVSSEPADYQNAQPSAWSEAAVDRAAKREYRRSLPPLYRWRRVIIAVLVAGLATAGIVVLHRDPVGIIKDVWYGLNRQYVPVTPVQATVLPAEAIAAEADPARLVDGTVEEFTMRWEPSAESRCGPAGNTGIIVLTFAPTRIRQVSILPGLAETNPQRPLQPLPKDLGLSFDDGPCRAFRLTNTVKQEPIKLDSEVAVTSVRIGIGSAYPAGTDAQPLISITEIRLQAYPS